VNRLRQTEHLLLSLLRRFFGGGEGLKDALTGV
jgi:hypothetical protein